MEVRYSVRLLTYQVLHEAKNFTGIIIACNNIMYVLANGKLHNPYGPSSNTLCLGGKTYAQYSLDDRFIADHITTNVPETYKKYVGIK